ncbi:hypothetical protein BP6252_09483 [Coleophoma cylindrospora]|uniref:Diaminopimelate epimerase-like protein n=1 Tax=Coleophoma cylindrospora TaxID=1849047 RepID=A0A3D8R232_9HELO|nr:hypothetical protein BP6252_09483 [Coleophoma cylindrospora]
MKLSFTTLDVFTSTRYTGNPLAIIEVPAEHKQALTQVQKQKIAAEFNLSESVFLHLSAAQEPLTEPTIDIFTPFAEVPFAGHPTVGTAFYLLNIRKDGAVALLEKAGRLPISSDPVTGDVKAEVPHDVHVHKVTLNCDLTDQPASCVSIVSGMTFVLVPLPDLPALAKATTHIQAREDVGILDEGWQNGLIGTMYFVAQGEDDVGRKVYRTRMFVEGFEDPGTGSASCALACWLALQEGGSQKHNRFAFVQGVEMGRRNDISVEVAMNEKGDGPAQVFLSGTAVKVMEGSLEV